MSDAATPPTEPGRPSPLRWWVCGLLFLATTLNYMDRQALSQLGLRVRTSLGFDALQYSRLESGFAIAFAIGAVTTGIVVDRVNVRLVYPVMVIGWSAAGILTGFATGFWSLLACRVMLGLFEAGNWPCGLRTTRTILGPAERSFGNSIFQSGTAIGAIITPFLVLYFLDRAGSTEDGWKLPFKAIGLLGIAWVVLWFVTVPRRLLAGAVKTVPTPGVAPATIKVWQDIRFWVLLVMVVAINVTWHTYRAWLPQYLQEVRKFDDAQMANFTTAFYVCADLGSLTAGAAAFLLTRAGFGLHASRTLVYAAGSVLALVGVAVPFLPTGGALIAATLVFGFAVVGLFPTYFTLSQEISTQHKGKVTGTLGAAAYLMIGFVAMPLEGWLIKTYDAKNPLADGVLGYDAVLGTVGVLPLPVLALMLVYWPPRRERASPSS